MNEVRRGTVISFDNSLWQAKILLDGADNEATIAVGQWVPDTMLAVDSVVAVLVFGETDTDDGVVLGPYGAGAASGWSYPKLSGLTTGQVLRATGAAAAAYGKLDLANANAYDQTAIATLGGLNIGAGAGAATGEIVLPNNGNISALDTGAVKRVVFYLDAANSLVFGRSTYAGNTIFATGSATSDIVFENHDFTARARITPTPTLLFLGTQVLGVRKTGYTNAWVTTAAERATARDAATITLVQLAQRVRALQDDLVSHGVIGP